MAWLESISEEVAHEFVERSSCGSNELAREMIISGGVRVFERKTSSIAAKDCAICNSKIPTERQVNDDVRTCSKRCTQALRRKTLSESGICLQCKGPRDRNGVWCSACCASHVSRSPSKKNMVGKVVENRRQIDINDRVLVIGCGSSESSDVYSSMAEFIGKRGRVIRVFDEAPEVQVQFRKKRYRFRASELSKLS